MALHPLQNAAHRSPGISITLLQDCAVSSPQAAQSALPAQSKTALKCFKIGFAKIQYRRPSESRAEEKW
jgi:hypothetical protein